MTAMETLMRRREVGEDLHSVVRVMKSMSAVSIKQFDEAADVVRAYEYTIRLGLKALMQRSRPTQNPPASGGNACLIIAIGSDRGLCGRFNEAVAACAKNTFQEAESRGEAALVLSIGVRVAEHLVRLNIDSQIVLSAPPAVTAISDVVETLVVHIDELRGAAAIEKVSAVYNTRTSDSNANATKEGILPISEDWLSELIDDPWPARGLPTYSVSPDELFSTLIREHLFTRLFQAITESAASEHASRLAAMQRADKHIEDFLSTLNAEIRERRQSSITQELLDIVASYGVLQSRRFEALESEANATSG